ncbi:MAG: hypothetical protein Q8N77_03080 [Nanoarchaeota archaeon]|nr:hypothetical protein [Nanoarchaeota archaeon]
MKEDDSKHVEDCATEQEPKLEYKKEAVAKKKTARSRMPLRSIPPRTMRDRTGCSGGSITDLPAKLLELQKRLQYVAQEVGKARERGEDVTPKIESGGCLNIGGYELDLKNIGKSLNLGEGAQGLEKMLNTGGLGGLLKNILGNLDIEKLKEAIAEYSKSSGYEKDGKKPVIGTSIKVSQLGENPKEWTGLSGSESGIVSERNKGSGSTGLKYQKGGEGLGGGVGSINKGAGKGLGEGRIGQKIGKTVKKTSTATQPEDFKLKDIIEKELDYEIFPKGDTSYEIIVNELGVEKIDTVKYNKNEKILVINEKLKIPLKGYEIKDVLDWEYRNDVLTINLKK